MTDLETIKQILDKAGIVYSQETRDNKDGLFISAKDGPNNLGYSFFWSELEFINGQLKTWGTWE